MKCNQSTLGRGGFVFGGEKTGKKYRPNRRFWERGEDAREPEKKDRRARPRDEEPK